MARVLVLGGGFGGIEAATSLRRMLGDGDEVILIARDHRFAMGWTKIWDLVGIRDLEVGTRELPELAEQGIRFVHADITAIDPHERGVVTSEGDFQADGIVVALGAGSDPAATRQLDGVHGHDLYDFAALPAAKRALAATEHGDVVVAVMGQPFKCPPAPFEAVLALDEHFRARGIRDRVRLTIATPSPGALPVAGPDASRVIADVVRQRDVELRLEHLLVEVDAATGMLTFEPSATLHADLLFGVPGAVPPAAIAASDLAGPGGWIYPDPLTLATDVAQVYAVGDCTTVPTATAALPKAGVFAAGEARIAAQNLAADLGAGPAATFDGHGHCYLEFPGRQVAVVEGNFYAQPKPQVALTPPSIDAYDRKVAFETDTLRRWFGR